MANYSLDNFVDPIMVLNRAGTSDDPYIQKIENLKVYNNTIVLDELPVLSTGVKIENMYEKQLENDGLLMTLNDDEFYVDYRLGVVYFNGSQDNLIKRVVYMGRGLILYPIERFYRMRDGGDIEFFEDTINDLVSKVDILQQIVNSGSAVTSVNGKTGATVINANDVGAIDLNLPRVETAFKFITGDEAIQIMAREFDMGWISWYPIGSAPATNRARMGFMEHQSQQFLIENSYEAGQIYLNMSAEFKVNAQDGDNTLELVNDTFLWNGKQVATINDIDALRTELNNENVSVNGDTMVGDLVMNNSKIIVRNRVSTTVEGVPVNTDNDFVMSVDGTTKDIRIFKQLNATQKQGVIIKPSQIDFVTESSGTKVLETTEGAQAKATTALNSAKTYTDTSLDNLMNTIEGMATALQELSEALANDPNFATSIMTLINARATITYVDNQVATLLSNINTRETKTDATNKLNQAKAYTDTVFANVPSNTVATQLSTRHGLGLNTRPLRSQTPVRYWVDGVNGNDSHSGTSSTPFKTIGKAVSMIPNIIEEGVSYIYIRPATYNEHVEIKGITSPHSIVFKGINFASRDDIKIKSMRIDSNMIGSLYFEDMRFNGVAEMASYTLDGDDIDSGTGNACVHLDHAGRVVFKRVAFARSTSEGRIHNGLYAHGMTNVSVHNCRWYGLKSAIYATDGADVFVKGEQDGGWYNYFAIIRSARVYRGAGYKVPKASLSESQRTYGGQLL
jgi:hypothetical protein